MKYNIFLHIFNLILAPCAAGSYWNQTTLDCELCPIDTYQEEIAQNQCNSCPPFLFSDVAGATSSTTCLSM